MDAAVIALHAGTSDRCRVFCRNRHDVPAVAGFALVEVMVTIVLLTIGLIGLAGLQARTAQMEMESYQRTQALILAQDMAERIVANKISAARYVGDDYGSGAAANCGGLSGFQFDLCTWGNAIQGATERSGAVNAGSLLQGRGCVAAKGIRELQVIVAWQGLAPTVAPGIPCGRNSYGAERYRRAVVVPVFLADLGGA
ncbi:MAG: type IV pilus modification protein PilV [Acidobacteriota bacterium]